MENGNEISVKLADVENDFASLEKLAVKGE